jgi:hypothetical protein
VLKLAWFIGRVDPSKMPNLGTWSLLLQKPAALVVSAYYAVYSPTLHLRAEAFSGNGDEAQTLTDKVATFLGLFHAAEDAVAGSKTDPDVRAFFDSLRVERQGDRAVLTAAVPPGFLRKVMGAPLQLGPERESAPETPPRPASPTARPQPTGNPSR